VAIINLLKDIGRKIPLRYSIALVAILLRGLSSTAKVALAGVMLVSIAALLKSDLGSSMVPTGLKHRQNRWGYM
jgi:hypothetical protein